MGGLKRLPTAPTEVQDGRGEHPRILFPSLQSSPYFFFLTQKTIHPSELNEED